ncbi:copper resistance protein CopC [Microbacterium sp. KUDC0406]|uniref:copper resistance CopC family protein n=1 Tax=Microbacterium sp. KUDC0406 TaxID=2909588 RepID=UPI001F41B630|nr:copper resistance CopC family protein [Microbacterium sp. KUDC0406]UJP09709.1 copper resistance protein CopC [Microbacterium sp. KUDC0406]
MTARRRTAWAVVGILLGLIAVPVGATAASAHDSLVDSDPATGSTVTTLTKVDLTFSADPIGGEGADVIQVKGPDGRYYETGCPALNGSVVSTPVQAGPEGDYEVLWRVVSSDGHPVAGTFTFTFAPDGNVAAAKGSADPQCGPKAPASADSSDAAGSSSAPTGLWIGLGIGAVVLVATAGAAVLFARRPRRTDHGE